MLKIFRNELLSCRRWGRRLAAGLLKSLHSVSQAYICCHGATNFISQMLSATGQTVTHQAVQEVLRPIIDLLKAHPECFILRGYWLQYESSLVLAISQANSDLLPVVAALSRRNQRLGARKISASNGNGDSTRHRIMKVLHSNRATFSLGELSEKLLALAASPDELITVILEWSCTRFQTGLSTVFVATRLLRMWKRSGLDTDGPILSFMQQVRSLPAIMNERLYNVVSQLVRSKDFAVGRYLQRLMSTASLEPGCLLFDKVSLTIFYIYSANRLTRS